MKTNGILAERVQGLGSFVPDILKVLQFLIGILLSPYLLVLLKIWPFGPFLPSLDPNQERQMLSFQFPFGVAFVLAFSVHLAIRGFL